MTSFKDKFFQNKINQNSKLTIRPDYTFHSVFQNQVKACDTEEGLGSRLYLIDGEKYPSVTTVLGATQSKEKQQTLKNWRNRIGQEEADRKIKKAAKRGTNLHHLCENFILSEKQFELPESNTNLFGLWKQVYPFLIKINNIHSMESVLYSKRLKIAGRVDIIAEYENELSIIDFKSGTKEKDENWYEDYFCQETAYALLFSEMYGIKVKQIVTLFAFDGNLHAKEGKVIVKKASDYVEKLLKRIKQYHNNNGISIQ